MNHGSYQLWITAALLPLIASQIRTLADFQKIPEKEIATCAEVSSEEEVKSGKDTCELRFVFFKHVRTFMWHQEPAVFTEGLE